MSMNRNRMPKAPDVAALDNIRFDSKDDAEGAFRALGRKVIEDSEILAETVRSVGDFSRETNSRLTTMEQMVAQAAISGGGSYGPLPGIGNQAITALGEDMAFQGAAEIARRNQKVGQLTCRVNLDTSIRAALTNEGSGSSADGSFPTQPQRNPNIIVGGLRTFGLLDVLPHRPTSSDSFEYTQLNSTGEASEQLNEGDEKAEIDFDGELLTGYIATIAGHTSASKQVLADNAALQAAIDRVIRHKVLKRLENRIVNGTGGQGQIDGLLNQAATFIPTIGTTAADVIGESLVRQANNGYAPDVVLMNPLDWFRIQITRTVTEEDYVFGSPTMPVPPALWNTRIVATPAVPEFSVLTLDSSFVTVLDREQLSVTVTNTHKDYFTRNLVCILAELRAGLEVTDAFAVYKIDLASTSGP